MIVLLVNSICSCSSILSHKLELTSFLAGNVSALQEIDDLTTI